jgi:hypothetical protein
MEQAIDQKIQEQAQFVAWWRENVTSHKGARTDLVTVPLLGISQEEVDEWKMTVHRWAKSLQKEPEYRARLLG